MNESSLHSAIKEWYSLPEDEFEVKTGQYVADIVRGDLIVEIQIMNFSAIKNKLKNLVHKHRVRLVYPIVERKFIVHINKSGEVVNRRRSPRKGKLTDLFRELVRIPELIKEVNFSLEVLLIDEEEIRIDDGIGNWRRRGASIKDRKLISVNSIILFENSIDFLKLLPEELHETFTNKELAKSKKVSVRTAQRITYCFRRSGMIRVIEKRGRELVFQKT
ncbi:hypothetical protein MUP00_03215 [Candidatus Bathyarchaeota archaeon]|jgi:hypothetical protein|nr:hypothetical protein [Candidatus Bathyarchaeota archaeon]